jgi:hypothetical protein
VTNRKAYGRRVRRLEHAMCRQGLSFVIQCRDGEEDSERIDRLCSKIENDYGPLDSSKDQIIISRVFGSASHISDDVLVLPMSIP